MDQGPCWPEGNEQADQAAKKGSTGESHMKETQTPIPWQVAKNKIEAYTTTKWKQKWITAPHYKHTKLFYDSSNKNKSKYLHTQNGLVHVKYMDKKYNRAQ